MHNHAPETPAILEMAIADIRAARFRRELRVSEIPAPASRGSYAFALAGNIADGRFGTGEIIGLDADAHGTHDALHEDESAGVNGRLALFYDENSADIWGAPMRIVMFASSPLDPEIGADLFIQDVCWAWLTESLERAGAVFAAPAGTVTKLSSFGYGSLANDSEGAVLELRASWTVTDLNLKPHVEAWAQTLSLLAGLPENDGLASLDLQRNRKLVLQA